MSTEITYTEPPGMPEDERMTDAEFRIVREYLGLTGDWLAAHLGVNPRAVRRWEEGRHPVPDGVRLAMEDLEQRTGEFVGGIIEHLNHLAEVPGVLTYRSDADYQAHHPEAEFPASWHRAVVARVAQEVPALEIAYWQPERLRNFVRVGNTTVNLPGTYTTPKDAP